MALEALLKDDVRKPEETSLAMLGFVNDLGNGGKLAKVTFFNLIVPLCDKILGKIGGKEEEYRYQYGGWMEERTTWVRPHRPQSIPTPTSGGPLGNLQRGPDFAKDPVVKLLATSGPDNDRDSPERLTLVEALSLHSEMHSEYSLEFPFLALPKPIQDAWLDIFERHLSGTHSLDNTICSENDQNLLCFRLRNKLLDQPQLRQFYDKQKSRILKPNQQYVYANNPGVFHTPPQSPTASFFKEEASNDPQVLLTALEYFLIRFLRLPLFLPDPQTASSTSSSTIPGATIHHLPGQRFPMRATSKKKYGHDVYLYILQKQFQYFLSPGTFALQEEAYLFLEVIISHWFEACFRLSPDSKAQADWKQSRMRARLTSDVETNLNASHDLTQLDRYPFRPPSQMLLSAIRYLALHLIRIVPSVNDRPHDWNMEPFMAKMQQPFYNFIRGVFRFASISSGDNRVFHDALDIWLIWLEPWNRLSPRRGNSPTNLIAGSKGKRAKITVDIPGPNSNSRYNTSWEPYIVANLYIYLIPLAIFIRRARELDFRSGGSLQTVSKVFRVFTPEVINVLNRHVDSKQALVEQHRKLLGCYCPSGTLQLSSLERDLKQLFEDIDSRHAKNSEQGLSIPSWLGGGNGSLLSDGKVVKLKERAIVIAQLPLGSSFSTVKAPDASSMTTDSPARPDRLPNGDLSDSGWEQIWRGVAYSSSDEISYVGDHMRRAPKSHEPEILVFLFVVFSDFLSDTLGLSKETPGKRVNLRWLADYRHLLFTLVAISFMIWYWF